ncbi:MAG TPA: hypothetical protein VK215_06730 [Acidimicrobiales bacterium]|nr:hypothetical protein [Acidimicrobiales bacterium]
MALEIAVESSARIVTIPADRQWAAQRRRFLAGVRARVSSLPVAVPPRPRPTDPAGTR